MIVVGDIGGTKTDLAVFETPDKPLVQKRFPTQEYPSLEAVVRACLAEYDLPVTHGCFAVAGPVVDGRAALTNLPWLVEEDALETALGLERVVLLNDVEAMATAIPHLGPDDLRTLRNGEPAEHGTIALIAPGTGLGEAFLVWDGSRYRAYPAEGSHTDFGPTTVQETELLAYLQRRWGRVSYERVCSGRHIPEIYEFLRDSGAEPEAPAIAAELTSAKDRTPVIMGAAFRDEAPDALCLAAMNLFATILGSAAGNLALTVMATGGVYISGGIIERILPHASGQGTSFLAGLENKGRLTPLVSRVPVHIISRPVALTGAALRGFDELEAEQQEREAA